MIKTQPLVTLMQDDNYAWDLLQSEIAIDSSDNLTGADIAKLLELYMRGVEKMNSVLDKRQSYFRNKVTSLLAKNNVIKSLNRPPPKEEKIIEIPVVNEQKKKEQKNVKGKNKKSKKQQTIEKTQKQKKPETVEINIAKLEQKKKQMQLRLAYEAQQHHNPERLRKILADQNIVQQKITKKIESVMRTHQQLLNERINKRKLKTSTFRSKPEQSAELLINNIGNSSNQNQNKIKRPIISVPTIPQNFVFNPQCKNHKSLDNKMINKVEEAQSIFRRKKYSFDQTLIKTS